MVFASYHINQTLDKSVSKSETSKELPNNNNNDILFNNYTNV